MADDSESSVRARIGELAKAFEEESEPVRLATYAIEDWVCFAAFWGLAACLILQFVTRYVLNNSLAWTEEVASNGLVVVVFLGSVMCVRLGRHIQVDLVHRLIPGPISRALQATVDLLALVFFAYMAWLVWRYAGLVGHERMISIDLPRGWLFYTVLIAFTLMFLRGGQRIIARLSSADPDAKS